MSTALQEESARIRLKMASLRRHMHKDARRIVANTNRLLDWKDQIGQFPKTLVAAGLVLGFVFMPGRKVERSVNLSQQSMNDLLSQQQLAAEPSIPRKSTAAAVAIRMLTGLVLSGTSMLLRRSMDRYLTSPTRSDETSPGRPFGSN